MSANSRTVQAFFCLVLCGILLTAPGCLRRRMTINSNPQGAMVYVDDHQIGRTPVSTDFTYYGTRNIRLEMDNYQTLNVKQPVRPPWYQIPPFDFFSETFSVGEIKDRHVWTYDLKQSVVGSEEQLIQRGREFAYEGSRTVNPDGTLGAPVARENLNAPPGLPPLSPEPSYSPESFREVPAATPAPAEITTPPYDPNALPEGSQDWDSPPR